MSSTSNIPFNDPTIQAIENAIQTAADDFCQQVTLYRFDPWAGGFSAQSSHQSCYHFFDSEIAGIANQIPGNQNIPDLVSFASTRGWLYGYSCAQKEAKPEITGLRNNLNTTRSDLNTRIQEVTNLERNLQITQMRLQNIMNTPQGTLFRGRRWARYWCGVLGLIAAVAIVVIIINWPI